MEILQCFARNEVSIFAVEDGCNGRDSDYKPICGVAISLGRQESTIENPLVFVGFYATGLGVFVEWQYSFVIRKNHR